MSRNNGKVLPTHRPTHYSVVRNDEKPDDQWHVQVQYTIFDIFGHSVTDMYLPTQIRSYYGTVKYLMIVEVPLVSLLWLLYSKPDITQKGHTGTQSTQFTHAASGHRFK